MHTVHLPHVANLPCPHIILYLGGALALLLCVVWARKKAVRPPLTQSRWAQADLKESYATHESHTLGNGVPDLAPRFFDLPDFPATNIYHPPLKSTAPFTVTSGDLAAAVQQRTLQQAGYQQAENMSEKITYPLSEEAISADRERYGAFLKSTNTQMYQDPDTTDRWTRKCLEFSGS